MPTIVPLSVSKARTAIRILYRGLGAGYRNKYTNADHQTRQLLWRTTEPEKLFKTAKQLEKEGVAFKTKELADAKATSISIHVPATLNIQEVTKGLLQEMLPTVQPKQVVSPVLLANHLILTLRPYMSGDDLEIKDPVQLAQIICDRAKEDRMP